MRIGKRKRKNTPMLWTSKYMVTTSKCRVCPYVSGLKCQILEWGYFEDYYDLKIKLPSGMITYANSDWFEFN